MILIHSQVSRVGILGTNLDYLQCRSSPALLHSKCLQAPPLMVIYKKSFRRYATS